MYCTCRGGHKEGYSQPIKGDTWIHSTCRLVPQYVFERITGMLVPHKAKSVISVFSKADGANLVTFLLADDETLITVMYYHPYPFKDAPMTEQRDVLVKFWEDLDKTIDKVRDPMALDHLRESEKVRARTYAEVLAFLMHRFYEDSTAILKESMARWTARQDGVTDHQTPGLAEALWDPSTRYDGTPYSSSSEAKVRAGGRATATKARLTGNRIPDSAVDSCRQGIELKMFTVAQFAVTYKMTEDEVKQQLGLV